MRVSSFWRLIIIFCETFEVRDFIVFVLYIVVERASVTIGEPTYDTTVTTFGDLGRVLTDDINKVFQQTGIPTGEFTGGGGSQPVGTCV